MKDLTIYSIGEAAKISGLSTSTLRYYDTIGLISPESRGNLNNYRYYTHYQVVTLCIVRRMRDLNCSLADIRTFIETDDPNILRVVIQNNIRSLNGKIEALQKNLSANENYYRRLSLLQTGLFQGEVVPEIQLEEIPVVRLFTCMQTMENYDNTKTSIFLWQSFLNQCQEMGYDTRGTHFTTYETPLLGQFTMGNCPIRFGLEVPPDSEGDKLTDFGGFTAATLIHVGSYANMLESHIRLLHWIAQNDCEVDGHVTEQMLLSPMDTAVHQVIKIIIPVRKR